MSGNGYTSGVSPFQKGQTLSARQLEKMREADQRALPMKGVGTMTRQTPNGTVVRAIPQPKRGGGAHPFKIFNASDDEGVKVSVVFGAVIDNSDWQDPRLLDPRIDGEKLRPDDPEDKDWKRPKLAVTGVGENIIYVKIKQDEDGSALDYDDDSESLIIESDTSLPTGEDGTLFVRIGIVNTKIDEETGKLHLLSIEQILASHIVWPWKPDFMGWRQRDEENERDSAWWLGAGGKVNSDCDRLEDLHIHVQREDFENGREGDAVFKLTMQKDEAEYALEFDKNEKQGFAVSLTETRSALELARKGEVDSGILLQTTENFSEVSLSQNDTESISLKTEAGKARATFDAAAPQVLLTAPNGTTDVTTVGGEEIKMRLIDYMNSAGEPMFAWFLCSQPSGGAYAVEHHIEHSGDHSSHSDHGNHHSEHGNHSEHDEHHTDHHTDGNHAQHGEHHSDHHTGHATHHTEHDVHHNDHHTDHHTDHTDENHDPDPDPHSQPHSEHHMGGN